MTDTMTTDIISRDAGFRSQMLNKVGDKEVPWFSPVRTGMRPRRKRFVAPWMSDMVGLRAFIRSQFPNFEHAGNDQLRARLWATVISSYFVAGLTARTVEHDTIETLKALGLRVSVKAAKAYYNERREIYPYGIARNSPITDIARKILRAARGARLDGLNRTNGKPGRPPKDRRTGLDTGRTKIRAALKITCQ